MNPETENTEPILYNDAVELHNKYPEIRINKLIDIYYTGARQGMNSL